MWADVFTFWKLTAIVWLLTWSGQGPRPPAGRHGVRLLGQTLAQPSSQIPPGGGGPGSERLGDWPKMAQLSGGRRGRGAQSQDSNLAEVGEGEQGTAKLTLDGHTPTRENAPHVCTRAGEHAQGVGQLTEPRPSTSAHGPHAPSLTHTHTDPRPTAHRRMGPDRRAGGRPCAEASTELQGPARAWDRPG